MENIKYVHTKETHNRNAPTHIVPEVIKMINPTSVIDIGCGTGTFLYVFQENGVKDILGIEGEWLDKSKLEVDEKYVIIADLEKPFVHNRKFDLAVCLEVVEHLSENSADTIIDTLTNLSDVVLFSGAIPVQRGQNHINMQWLEYWQEKFSQRGYKFYDELRARIWDNKEVHWWYKQNAVFAIKEGSNNFGFSQRDNISTLIHPDIEISFSDLFKVLFSNKIKVSVFSKILFRKILIKVGLRDKIIQ